MPEIKKILVIRFSSFGDIVLTYPFITQLRKKYPSAQIDFLTREKFIPLLRMHKCIDKIIEYRNEKLFKLREKIRESKYDIIIDIHKNIRSICSTMFTRPKKIRYKKGTLEKLIFVAFKINLINEVTPVYKRYLLALDRIRFPENLDFASTDLDFEKEPIVKEPYILIAPSSKHYTKTLPKEKYEQIIGTIKNYKVVLTGDNTEKDSDICKYLSDKYENAINYCGKSDFNSLANLIFNSRLVICNDSGILHFTEALNKKAIVFFGSTVEQFGFYPQTESTVVFENKYIKCRPCTHIGKKKCPKKHFKCMQEIEMNEAIKKINENIS